MEAFVWGDNKILRSCLNELKSLQLNKIILAQTGIGYLVSNSSGWPSEMAKEVSALCETWKVHMNSTQVILRSQLCPQYQQPFGGQKIKIFTDKVDNISSFFKEVDGREAEDHQYKRIGLDLALQGFSKGEQVTGMTVEEWPKLYANPVITRILERVTLKLRIRQKKRSIEQMVMEEQQALEDAKSQTFGVKGNAASTGEEFVLQAKPESLLRNDGELQSMGITPNNTKMMPRQILAELNTATLVDQAKVQHTLSERGEMMKLASFGGSIDATRSGLKSWHKFALLVWNYPESATLPPKKPAHVISYVTIFSNTGTAYNYVGHIKRGCIYKNYPIEWYTGEVTMALSGLKKICLKWYGGPTRTTFLMTSKMVQMIVGYNTPNGKVQFARCLQLSWQFLLRLKSEAMVVWKGEPADLGKLPFNRDNSIWVDEQKTLHLKLRKRKNRPWGSNLQATCQCKTRPGECIPCIFYTWLLNFEVG